MEPTPREIWMSRLKLIAFFGTVGVMAFIAFFSGSEDLEVQNPPNARLVQIADQIDARFETWDESDGQIAFVMDSLAEGREPEDVQVTIETLAAELALDSLRELNVVRVSGRLKISGYVAVDESP